MTGPAPRSAALRFLRDERGSAAIEFVIWVQGFALLLMLFADISVFLLSRSDMARATREATRMAAVGVLEDDEIQGYLATRLHLPERGFWVDTSGTDDIVVEVTIPLIEVTVFGFIRLLDNEPLILHVEMPRETGAPATTSGGASS